MKVTLLGSGTCVPRLSRSACAVLVETRVSKILLDLGPGTMRRLLHCGVSIFDLTHIAISHFHPDHTAELVPLLFATKYPDNAARTRPLHLLGGNGLKRFYQALQGAYGDWIVLPKAQLVLTEIDTLAGESLPFDDFSLTARPVAHRPESLAYRIEDQAGPVVVYSGDTEPCPGLVAAAHQADLFICESAMPDGRKVPGHLTPSLAGQAATQARARRLVLTHLYPPCDEVDIVKQAQGTYKGPVFAAEDLMRFLLP
jgi:ribonuclease BN (tRNA processing enzyme)